MPFDYIGEAATAMPRPALVLPPLRLHIQPIAPRAIGNGFSTASTLLVSCASMLPDGLTNVEVWLLRYNRRRLRPNGNAKRRSSLGHPVHMPARRPGGAFYGGQSRERYGGTLPDRATEFFGQGLQEQLHEGLLVPIKFDPQQWFLLAQAIGQKKNRKAATFQFCLVADVIGERGDRLFGPPSAPLTIIANSKNEILNWHL